MAMGILLSAHAWGLDFEPLSVQFAPSGRESVRTFYVENTQDDNIAVRIRMSTRHLREDGREVRDSAASSFVVFPETAYLSPGQRQAVRVQWRGDAQLTREEAYRIIVEQVPVDGGAGEDGRGVSLEFIYRYIGAVYVGPSDSGPDIVLERTELRDAATAQHDGSELLLHLHNRGTGHGIVEDMQTTVRGRTPDGSAVEYEFAGETLSTVTGTNFLAGATLVQSIDIPVELASSSLEVEHSIQTSR